MSRKLTHKCDGCGVEYVDEDEIPGMPPGMPGIVGGLLGGIRRRQGMDRWSSLSVGTDSFPAMFDLCEACTKRVLDMLEITLPKPGPLLHRHLGGFGHAVPFVPGDFMAPPSAPPWASPKSGLTPDDLRELGITMNPDGSFSPSRPPPPVAPGVDFSTGMFTCPKCNASRDCQSLNPICIACGYQDPDPKYR